MFRTPFSLTGGCLLYREYGWDELQQPTRADNSTNRKQHKQPSPRRLQQHLHHCTPKYDCNQYLTADAPFLSWLCVAFFWSYLTAENTACFWIFDLFAREARNRAVSFCIHFVLYLPRRSTFAQWSSNPPSCKMSDLNRESSITKCKRCKVIFTDGKRRVEALACFKSKAQKQKTLISEAKWKNGQEMGQGLGGLAQASSYIVSYSKTKNKSSKTMNHLRKRWRYL